MIDHWLRLPDLISVLIMAGGYTVTGIALHWISFHPPWRPYVASYDGLVGPFFATSGLLFGLVTAFLGSSVADGWHTIAQSVMQEREGAIAIIELSEAVPVSAVQLRRLTKAYVRSVLNDEWNMPRDQGGSPATDEAFSALLLASTSPLISATVGSAIQGELIRAVERISGGRTVRLTLRDSNVDDLRWATVLILGLLTQISVAAVHLSRKRVQALALSLSTAAMITALGLIAFMEHPFEGIHTAPPDALRYVLTLQ